MGIFNTGYNFSNIRNLTNAAESLQTAGKDEECKQILKLLAKELNDESN